MTPWTIRRPILVVAPHLLFPTYNGGDISIERVARCLSDRAEYVDLITCDKVRRYRAGQIEQEQPYQNRLRSKALAGLRTVVFRSHYLHERFYTRQAKATLQAQLQSGGPYGTILASFLVTLAVVPQIAGTRRLVWTHNDEFKWFSDIAGAARNPLVRAAAGSSVAWLRREVPRLSEEAVFLHVTEADRQGYEQIAPGHRCVITSVGTDLDPMTSWPACKPGGPVILTFVSALGVAIAADALRHFRTAFEPALRAAFGSRLSIRIVGSNPSRTIQQLCMAAGWELHANVPDATLSRLLNESTFTILPFAYSTGIKLKLIRSIGSGIPFLSTCASQVGGFATPPGCCFSDQAADWVGAISAWSERQDLPAVRRALLAIAQEHSWPAVVERLVRGVELQEAKNGWPRNSRSVGETPVPSAVKPAKPVA